MWTGQRLRTRILLLFIPCILVIVGGMTFMSLYAAAQAIDREYRQRAVAIISTIGASYTTVAPENRARQIQTEIDALMKSYPDVFGISVYAPRGTQVVRIASSFSDLIGTAAERQDLAPMTTGEISLYNYEQGDRDKQLVEILGPITTTDKTLGSIGVYLRTAPRDAAIWEQGLNFGLGGLAGSLILLLALYAALDRTLLHPLQALRVGIGRVKSGRLDQRINAKSLDEIGQLADLFDEMTDTLQQRQAENTALHEELEKRYSEAREQAITDGLTTLHSHRYFQVRLAEELERAARCDHTVSLLFCDIDLFRTANDLNGHQFGDVVLQQMGKLIRENVRSMDVTARYGGEEFAIILPEISESQAYQAAERLRRAVASHQFGQKPPSETTLTVSIGMASYPTDATTREDLVRKADQAMGLAKQLGRNQVRLYRELASLEPFPDESSSGKVSLEGRRIMESAYLETIHSLAAAVDARDPNTSRHSENVARLATAVARALDLGEQEVRNIGVAGLLHDVGKIGVPDSILSKPGPLTEEEWEKVKLHPALGESIIHHASSLREIVPLVLHHQERFDGKGYPSRLTGEDIPLGARILAVADAYEAMSSNRPYRPAMSRDEIVAELQRSAGTHFDPKLVDVFLRIMEERDGTPNLEGSA